MKKLELHFFTAILFAMVVLSSCGDTSDEPGPNTLEGSVSADFTSDASNINLGETITFTSTENENVAEWSWTFDNGVDQATTASGESPAVTFTAAGTYTVSLTVVSTNDAEDTETKSDFITVNAPVSADFSVNESEVFAGGSLDFTSINNENVAEWAWTFDNGTDDPITASGEAPTVSFMVEGIYTASLTVTSIDGSEATETKNDFITVNPLPNLQSIDFDGNDDTFTIEQINGYGDNPLSLTVSAWIKTSASDKFMQIVCSHEQEKFFNISVRGNNTVSFAVRPRLRITSSIFGFSTYEAVSSSTVNDGNWHHVVGVWNHDSHTVQIYVDGILEGEQEGGTTSELLVLDQRTTIGSWKETLENFDGQISSVSLWKEPFNSTQIANMETCYEGTEDNLVGYWNFVPDAENVLLDKSSNENNMTFVGGDPTISNETPFSCE